MKLAEYKPEEHIGNLSSQVWLVTGGQSAARTDL